MTPISSAPDQIEEEIMRLMDFFKEVYGAFGLDDVRVELSTRPAKSIGSDQVWNLAETSLQRALEARNLPYQLNPGDGAFYGPKIDFHIRDCLKRSWQCGTIQLDFSMPERFGCNYVGTDGAKHTPVMIHRACFRQCRKIPRHLDRTLRGRVPALDVTHPSDRHTRQR